ncbi:hypothetical protein [Planktothrix agardhii]|jgi:hypothetical protein|uniref:hypothetical protein n=1 Tax=Planktothrix agardhii TaxID=1160 RepID=UPI001D0A4F9F|nr:hypothetical protein [Planktothrix agardhii]MCB8751613.1 hypothetical protein [Planktothrix agardhii 1810]MCB8760593.1 hypothetical protein [Planktothrix agardhii 1813]MEA5562045.1 hypothetical protein [Planktothrix agardhii UHCC 0887]
MSDKEMTEKTLLDEIVNCPHAQQCLGDSAAENLCRTIVEYQNTLSLQKFQVPEPWSGEIEKAPILFLSSNPSIGGDEAYPTWDWSSKEILIIVLKEDIKPGFWMGQNRCKQMEPIVALLNFGQQ